MFERRCDTSSSGVEMAQRFCFSSENDKESENCGCVFKHFLCFNNNLPPSLMLCLGLILKKSRGLFP